MDALLGSTTTAKKRIWVLVNQPETCPFYDLKEHPADWEFVLADQGARTALEGYDALIVEMGVRGVNTDDFLKETRQSHPQLLQFLWTDAERKADIGHNLKIPIQPLMKAWDLPTLTAALRRAFCLASWLTNHDIQKLMAQMSSIPSLPTVYLEIIKHLQTADNEISTVAQLISNDLALCAKILKLVNSSYFGIARPINDAFEGVMFLGVERVKALLLFAHFVSHFERSNCPCFSFDKLWLHSLRTASMARWIAKAENCPDELANAAYTAGFLHDLGKLMLAANLSSRYNQVLTQAEQEQRPSWEIEQATFGATHAELAGCQMGIWGLPYEIIEAIAWHHGPRQSERKQFSPLTAVHVADAFEQENQAVPAKAYGLINLDYLTNLGAAHCLPRWREVCGLANR